jgi:transcription antitermination factor NusG
MEMKRIMHWYTMRSKPNRELALSHELSARQVEVFYPQLRVHPVNPRSRTVRPYFPGYLFVHVDLGQIGFSELHWLPFSLGLLTFGGEPPEVPDGLVNGIQKHVDEINAAGGEVLHGLRQGEAVLILEGPFAGHEAIFDASLPGSERVRVLLKLLSRRQLPVELPTAYIQRRMQAYKPGRL